jgi:hypothetical protein
LQWAYGVALLSAATDIRSHLGEQLFDFCQLSDRLLFVTNQRIIQVKAGGSSAVPGRWGSVQFELPLNGIIAVFTEGNKLLVELDASVDGLAVGSCAKFFGKKQGSSMVGASTCFNFYPVILFLLTVLQVRTFDLKTPERRHFSSILMSAIMSGRAAVSSFEHEAVWRPVSMGAVVRASENSLRASIGGGSRPTLVKATIVGPQPWVSDDERSSCTLCNRKFNPFFRKHHCRMCGIIICSKCSPSRASLPDLGYQNLVRVCNPCFARCNVQNPFDAVDENISAAVPSTLTSQMGVSDTGRSVIAAPTASGGNVVPRGSSFQESPPSPFVGPLNPPPARSALAVIADAQKRALAREA